MEITSRKNSLIKEYRSLAADRKNRRKAGYFPCEGAKLCYEAASCGCALGENAFVTASAAEKYPDTVKLLEERCRIITISDEISEYISDTKSPQGIFITVKLLDKILNLSTINNSRHYIILENLQDTGNIGTIIRTCDAFGIDGVIISEDCADLFSPKTVRSTMGSLFRVPVYMCEPQEAIVMLREGGFSVYAAMLDENASSLRDMDLSGKTAVIIGNEGNGITEQTAKACNDSVYIPISGAESLNASVAASVFAWEMSKSR